MRAVYDTSVLATIFARRGEILKFKNVVLTGQVTPITSDYIVDELADVLSSKFGFTKQRAKSHSRLLTRVATVVIPQTIEHVSRDSNDDPILATAVSGKVDYVVTFDEDLLILKEYRGIKIVTPAEFEKLTQP
jgi:putative PIN family toxin of toxin-antitoxin system